MKIALHVDPTRCRGYGICALLHPDGLELDTWGFGRAIDVDQADRRSLVRARRAARACPNGAIVVSLAETDTDQSAGSLHLHPG